MPSMPDPISECPIFGRFFEFSQDQDQVDAALKVLSCKKKQSNFVDVGVAFGIIRPDSCFDCGGTILNEEEYLRELWFNENGNGWWPHRPTWEYEVCTAIRSALTLSSAMKLPIKGWWECPDARFEASAQLAQPKKDVIWLRVETPPGLAECYPAKCP